MQKRYFVSFRYFLTPVVTNYRIHTIFIHSKNISMKYELISIIVARVIQEKRIFMIFRMSPFERRFLNGFI